MSVELSVLDLVPESEHEGLGAGIARTLELARAADDWGYRGFWLAEHHLSPGVSSSTPAVLAALVASSTRRLRVGSAASLLAVTTPAVAAEQWATIARAVGGRVDLGFGRVHGPAPAGAERPGASGSRVVDGLPVPAAPPPLWRDPALVETLTATARVLGVHRADAPPFADELRLALDLLRDGHTDAEGRTHGSSLLSGAPVDVHVLASSGGESARVAGELGLPLVANYHVAPASVLDTVATYRDAFRPGVLPAPRVAVSADVVVAATDAEARELARPYAQWVLGIRRGTGAVPIPSPQEVDAFTWSAEDEALVADRLEGHVVGSPETVVPRLEALARVTGAEEILVTTATYRAADRFRSYELLAQAWRDRSTVHLPEPAHATA
ncbi:LLM class flavin-dependent oxidoreductase [Kineococcus rhizosphaerae]|uniref:Luciferase family oxidoreductase group 1 n=1 Tax=Kineococcus rhizosphaerae TaxID=559628 RepID=A0A2T0R1B2_9ACTN|nr:LLM class flavin-dependent oxidoreductase [Kineococcus rhizosphaerae]PRY13077.1 luciferase family oxidoreductase group 1 [Kineococcus rhizosphaerae]